MVSKNQDLVYGILHRQIPVDEKVLITAAEKYENTLDTMFKLNNIPSENVMFASLTHFPEYAASTIYLHLTKLKNPSKELVEKIRKIINPDNKEEINDLIDKKLKKDMSGFLKALKSTN